MPAGGALEFLLEPVVNAARVEDVAAVEHLYLHALLERIEANAAEDCVVVEGG